MMKRFQLFVAAMAIGAFAALAAGPKAVPVAGEYNFGNVAEKGGRVSHEFKIVNTGDKPLVFISATASCGCTRPVVPKEPVAPGDTGIVAVSYEPLGRPGEFNKTITVKTNAKPAKVKLRIVGVVVP
ncbi:MAG: DUF1573 domain-containing protein [Muribaculum sp.]|nr:DUF1573 domain-containing protein [Muribaculaceae bacterium]MCM1080329.1 DUF1573 domain-containing protein [Muribaculum sp.]